MKTKCYTYSILDPTIYKIGEAIRKSCGGAENDHDFILQLVEDSDFYEKIIERYESGNDFNGEVTKDFYQHALEQKRAIRCMIRLYST